MFPVFNGSVRGPFLIATMVVLASSPVADAAIVETEIASEKGATLVAAYGGWVVWRCAVRALAAGRSRTWVAVDHDLFGCIASDRLRR